MSLVLLFNDSPFFLINGEQNYSSSPFEFDAVNLGGANTFAPSTARYYSGARSYLASFDGTSGVANGYKSFTAQDEIYIEGRVWMSSELSLVSAWGAQTILSLMQGQWNPVIRLAISGDESGNPYRWYVSGNGITDTYSTEEVNTDEWLYIKFYWKYGAGGTSVFYVRINGITIASSNGYTCAYSDVTRFYVGGTDEFSRLSNGSNIYYDDIKAYLEDMDSGTDYFRSVSNSIGISDSLLKAATYIRFNQNSVGVTDLFNKSVLYIKSISNSVNISTVTNRVLQFNRSIYNSISINDFINKIYNSRVNLTNLVSVIDYNSKVYNSIRSIYNSVSVFDNIQRIYTAIRNVFNSVGIIDSVNRYIY